MTLQRVDVQDGSGWVFADVLAGAARRFQGGGKAGSQRAGDPGTARTGFQVTVSEVAAWRWREI